ncbi:MULTISPECIES: hypothetical protein [Streptomyces]|uniref:hypothetical protein n=1 Tax=Streptomyces TaxID=1883 RepID=UPI001E56E1DF|nr:MULTISPECIES: hypothetical protein [Streptomyces]UFQ18020.1 hypothetical protein J2N69_25155 [Streptomyces huasconensis]WCL87631.1 hypothetical protein PPN52_25155 [Streptomyces sp. JCM 35825]
MAARTPAERVLARSFTTDDGATRFNVTDLMTEHQPDRSVTLTYGLIVEREGRADECWVCTLPWGDKSFADVFTSSAPDPERLRQLVELVRGLLEEWWDTKGHNRRSAKLGRRCP